MTRVPVTDVSQLMPYAVDTSSKVQSGGTGFGDSLKAAMSNQSSTKTDMSSTVTEPKKEPSDDSVRTTENRPSEKDNRVDSGRDDRNDTVRDKKAPEDEDDKIPDEVTEEVAETAVSIIKEIADVMDVSEEEVVQAVDELGLGVNDLLDANNLADIITKLSGSEDTISLLTDEDLYSKLGELQDFVSTAEQNLMDELDLSQEALNEILDQSEEPVRTEILSELDMIPEGELQKPEAPIEGMKDYKVTSFANGKEITTNVKVDDATGAMTANTRITAESDEEDKGNPSNENGEGNKQDAEPGHVQFLSQEVQNNNEINMADQTNFDEVLAAHDSETERIADQILESMKINMKSDTTSLEMNLHPASLGSVRVNLTAQNGQVTAQFIAQNETVRAAIESQVVQLTNQLEDQGIKVESVEVAVADHSFEHEGGDTAGQNGSNEGSDKPRAGRVRRIDLSSLEDEADMSDLEDADRIAAQMMAHEGNKVDYTA